VLTGCSVHMVKYRAEDRIAAKHRHDREGAQ
jgi:hypothetical protein